MPQIPTKRKRERWTVIVDGMNLFFRSMFRFIELTDPEGNPTGSVYGFTAALVALAREFNTNRFIVVWEGEDNWKKRRSAQYKKDREKRTFTDQESEAMKYGMPMLHHFLKLNGIPQVKKREHEADDVIAHLARNVFGEDVIIYSNDKDFLQLVSGTRRVFTCTVDKATNGHIGHKLMAEAEVKEKFGVPPNKMDLLLAIMGDAGDNVSGVRGFGPKKAVKLIQEGYITKQRISEVFNEEQVKEFLRSWSLVRLGRMAMDITGRDVTWSEMDDIQLEQMLFAMDFRKNALSDFKMLYNAELYNQIIGV